eukprot:2382853-Pyramimonas_sp.AAC.1
MPLSNTVEAATPLRATSVCADWDGCARLAAAWQMVIGGSVGCRFVGMRLSRIADVAKSAAACTLLTLTTAGPLSPS